MSERRIEYDETEDPPDQGVAVRRAAKIDRGLAKAQRLSGRRRRPAGDFTWDELAREVGRCKRQLQRWAARGDFDPADFASVAKLLRARSGLRTDKI